MSQQKQYIPPEIQELWHLARQGQLWSLWIVYNVRGATGGSESKLLKVPNLKGEQVKAWRASMFKFGFTYQVGEGHWKVICPMDIVDVDIYKQNVYLPDDGENTKYSIV